MQGYCMTPLFRNNKKIQISMHTEEENKRLLQRIALLEEEIDAMYAKMQNLQAIILSNLSHDIRTPMNAIVGFANLLTNADMDAEEQAECIDHLNNHSSELLKIIDNMIDASQLQTGGLKLCEKEFHINAVLDEIYQYGRESIDLRQKKLDFTVTKAEGNDFSIFADLKRFMQVFHNLIDNATKFTSEGQIEFGYYRNIGNEVTFYVKDTGDGLGTINDEYLFKPFRSNMNLKSTGPVEGAGLGLSISKSLVELMGGEMWHESVPGKGTCFYFTLQKKKVSFLNEKLQMIGRITKQNIASFLY
jgi:signal transduction histidine kinase